MFLAGIDIIYILMPKIVIFKESVAFITHIHV